ESPSDSVNRSTENRMPLRYRANPTRKRRVPKKKKGRLQREVAAPLFTGEGNGAFVSESVRTCFEAPVTCMLLDWLTYTIEIRYIVEVNTSERRTSSANLVATRAPQTSGMGLGRSSLPLYERTLHIVPQLADCLQVLTFRLELRLD